MSNIFIQKFYFINKFEANNIENLDKTTSVIYRNYSTKVNIKEILNIQKKCRRKNIKFYIANNLKLAIKYNCDGLYIPSFNTRTLIKGKIFKKNFEVLGSAHNAHQIKQKEIQGAQSIFISSVFKKNKNYLGIYRFKLLSKLTNKKIVALGGINKNNIKKLKCFGFDRFAGISYFKKNPLNKN